MIHKLFESVLLNFQAAWKLYIYKLIYIYNFFWFLAQLHCGQRIYYETFQSFKFWSLAFWPWIWSILINVPAPVENISGRQNSYSHALYLLVFIWGYVKLYDKGILQKKESRGSKCEKDSACFCWLEDREGARCKSWEGIESCHNPEWVWMQLSLQSLH